MLLLSCSQIGFETSTSQFAGRAVSASVTDDTVVTRQRFVADDVEDSELVSHCPSLCLVYPHQRGVDDKLFVHRKVEADVKTLDERVAAVGIARKVCLADTSNYVADVMLAGIDGSNAQEEEVATGYKRVGGCALWLFLVHFDRRICERV